MLTAPFIKVRFYSKSYGETAGLILPANLIKNGKIDVVKASCYFPMAEFRKMEKVEFSPEFNTWDEAFKYQFKDKE